MSKYGMTVRGGDGWTVSRLDTDDSAELYQFLEGALRDTARMPCYGCGGESTSVVFARLNPLSTVMVPLCDACELEQLAAAGRLRALEKPACAVPPDWLE
jgi:hypothetical protein